MIERLGPSAAAVLPKLEQLQFGEDTSLQFAMVPLNLLGPKTNDLWKPVIGAVNGMACGVTDGAKCRPHSGAHEPRHCQASHALHP